MQDPVTPPAPSRARLYWPLALLTILALAWSGFWFYAAGRTESTIAAWLEREANHGRVWTCPQRQTAGYPFRIEVACVAPTFSGPAGAARLDGSLGALKAYAQAWEPNHVLVDLDGPLKITRDDGAALEMAWSRLRLSLRGRPKALERLSLEGADGALSVGVGAEKLFGMRAAGFEAHMRQAPGRDDAYDLALSLRKAAIPALDAFLDLPEPADVDFVGLSNHLVIAEKGNAAERLEIWRAAGGRLDPASLDVRKGATRVKLTGGLGLDAAHRVDGKLQLEGDGLAPLAKRFGLNLDMVAAGNLLDGLFGGKPRKDGEPRKEGEPKKAELRLPLTLANGRVSIGPLRLPVTLTPLY